MRPVQYRLRHAPYIFQKLWISRSLGERPERAAVLRRLRGQVLRPIFRDVSLLRNSCDFRRLSLRRIKFAHGEFRDAEVKRGKMRSAEAERAPARPSRAEDRLQAAVSA